MNNWIKNAIFYQIYPTSFYDSNGDGIGDLNGITEKLSYVKEMGFNAVWINPFFKSPFMDGGYDVADYCAIDEKFGTMQDFDNLIKKAKELGIRVVIDLVIGHTSNEHPWFKKSSEFERNEYWDWYIWTDSIFNKYGANTIHGLYPRDAGYYMNYYACQPGLNYGFNTVDETYQKKSIWDLGESWKIHYKDERLKPLREEILRIMRFWLAKGVDGFRVDMAASLIKGSKCCSDDPKDIEGLIWLWDYFIGNVKKDYPEAVFVAEWGYPSNSIGKCRFDIDYLAHENQEYNELFRNEKDTNIIAPFEQGDNYFSGNGKGDISNFIKIANKFYEGTTDKGAFSVPSGYHDIVRIAEKKDEELLKVIFAFLYTFKHVPFIYYGDEIAMTHQYGINKDGGFIRTGARTPMQWTNDKNRGFSTADETYLPSNNEERQSVESMLKDENSLIYTVKALGKIRQENACLNADTTQEYVLTENRGYPFVYKRTDGKNTIIVYINPSNETFVLDKVDGEVLLSNNCFLGDKLTLNGKSFAIIKQ